MSIDYLGHIACSSHGVSGYHDLIGARWRGPSFQIQHEGQVLARLPLGRKCARSQCRGIERSICRARPDMDIRLKMSGPRIYPETQNHEKQNNTTTVSNKGLTPRSQVPG